ncbi:MAG: sulfur carrier protein ThiS [Spirochaetales bacterium]|nr:sulfur carrier protein ThiS [Spirochaetales bacterium]
MKVKLNGKMHVIPDDLTLLDLLKMKNLNPDFVAVQHNGGIMQKEKLAELKLNRDDEVEILHFMGGGQC